MESPSRNVHRVSLWFPGEGHCHTRSVTYDKQSSNPLRVPFQAIGISCESLHGSKRAVGGRSTWTWSRWIKVSVNTVQSMPSPLFSRGVLCWDILLCWLPAPSTSLPPSALMGKLAGARTENPISILTIQRGCAKYCSHIVHENTQDIYYISGGRTGSLIASAGCKL